MNIEESDAWKMLNAELNQHRLKNLSRQVLITNDFMDVLADKDMFDKSLFEEVRTSSGSQAQWAHRIGVSGGTISNWERGSTYPNNAYRQKILEAATNHLSLLGKSIGDIVGSQITSIDTRKTKNDLDNSILRASLSDFEFDSQSGQIISVPFTQDKQSLGSTELEDDKSNLLESLQYQADLLADQMKLSNNNLTNKAAGISVKYKNECSRANPNPRLLHRLGENLRHILNDDEFLESAQSIDQISVDGFSSDHIELMRLYFRSALAKAQEVEASVVDDTSPEPAGNQFYNIAEKLDKIETKDGNRVLSEDISVLLRDIGREINESRESEALTSNEERKKIISSRRKSAIKNGSIFIGRLVFFTSLFVVIGPGATTVAATNLASIITILDTAEPGSPRRIYEKLREYLPILPALPMRDK